MSIREIHEENERIARGMRLLWLQRQQEARRSVIPRFGPAVDGVLWSRIHPDESPPVPILSILEFSLKSGIDILDNSKPPRKLWDSVLQYVRSISGCCAVKWGPILDDPSATLLCMIHWDSAVDWRKFQYSLGFSPLIGLLKSEVSNRCAKLNLSGVLWLDGVTIVDVVSVTFDTQAISSPELRAAFEENWNTHAASMNREYEGLQHSHTVWLENNASTFFDPTPAEAAAAITLTTFIAFLAWDGEQYDNDCTERLCDSFQSSLSSSSGNEPTISRKTVQLINQFQYEDHDPPRQPAIQSPSLTSILQANSPRRSGADIVNLRKLAHMALTRSIGDARARTRLFPAPQGSFISQGEVYEGNMPTTWRWQPRLGPIHGYHFVDVAWMYLKPNALRTRGPQIYNQLNNEIGALAGFVKAFWARDVENKRKIAVLTVWNNEHAREVALHEYRRILDAFAVSSTHLAASITHEAFPMARGPVGVWLDPRSYIELTTFYIPQGAHERELFEQAYAAFDRMTVPSQVGGVPRACSVSDAGGWQPAEATENLDYQLFTGVMIWESPAARIEWYEDLFRLSCESYELFGHKLDALKLLAAGGSTSRFLALQSQ
ncbi:hypothetical protein ACSS6W_003557 [Trichoderma asperelloides]